MIIWKQRDLTLFGKNVIVSSLINSQDIREKSTDSNIDPIEILGKLIKKPDKKFALPKISYEETYKIILKMKLSGSSGLDEIDSKIIKMVPKVTAMMMTHLINSIITTGIYPDILKISRILPILKPGKAKSEEGSYRPINNLSVFDKIIQEWIKINLVNYFEDNKILINNHHWGRTNFSTVTAKSMIDYYLGKGSENNKFTAMINTDMSSAFDTVDHNILLRKLKFYRI